MADVRVTYHQAVEADLFTSSTWRNYLTKVGFTIVSHAVTETGVDTGALRGSMGFRIERGDEASELYLGSGAEPGVDEIWYAAPHWAKQPPMTPPPALRARRKSRPHPTKPAPTKPWTKALKKLGIAYEVEPGGFES